MSTVAKSALGLAIRFGLIASAGFAQAEKGFGYRDDAREIRSGPFHTVHVSVTQNGSYFWDGNFEIDGQGQGQVFSATSSNRLPALGCQPIIVPQYVSPDSFEPADERLEIRIDESISRDSRLPIHSIIFEWSYSEPIAEMDGSRVCDRLFWRRQQVSIRQNINLESGRLITLRGDAGFEIELSRR